MGKSKTRRQKYHASAVKLKQQASAGGQQPAAGDVEMTADSHGQVKTTETSPSNSRAFSRPFLFSRTSFRVQVTGVT